MNREFYAGVARVDITPTEGTIMNGDFIGHFATTIHDRLFVKALVFKDETISVAIIVIDTCMIDKKLSDQIKADIFQNTGIPSQNILVTCTHIHSAGSLHSVFLGSVDLSYMNELPEKIIQAVKEAGESAVPAQISFGAVTVQEHVVCRRYFMNDEYVARNPVTGLNDRVKTNPIGDEKYIVSRVSEPDPSVGFMAIKSKAGDWISILANYSMHYVGDFPPGTISSDYFGRFSDTLISLMDDSHIVPIMTNGTSGDTNIWDFLNPGRYPEEPYRKSQLIGSALAKSVFDALDSLVWDWQPSLKVYYQELTLHTRKPSPDELRIAREIIDTEKLEASTSATESMEQIFCREQLLLNKFDDINLVPVQAIKVGSGAIGALSGEFFAETGLSLKNQYSLNKYFTICHANGAFGYVPPASQHLLGGYETWRCRNSYLEFAAEEKIKNALLEMLSSQ